MIRLLISTLLHLVANAVGLLVAAAVLDGMTISGTAFVIAVGIFTVAEVVLGPLVRRFVERRASVLLGGTSLAVTFLGLLVTSVVSEGLRLEGASTWVLATVIVWLGALLATVLLPVIVVRSKRGERRGPADLAAGRGPRSPSPE
jgi:putative membrane protein